MFISDGLKVPLAFPRGGAKGLPVVGSMFHLQIYRKWESHICEDNFPPKAFVSFPCKVWPAEVCLLFQGLEVVVRLVAALREATSFLCKLLRNCPADKRRWNSRKTKALAENSFKWVNWRVAWYGRVPTHSNLQVPWIKYINNQVISTIQLNTNKDIVQKKLI